MTETKQTNSDELQKEVERLRNRVAELEENGALLQDQIDRQSLILLSLKSFARRQSTREDMIKQVLLAIKDYTDFESVGVRLAEGDDFPFYVVDGYDSDHLKCENSICACDESGKHKTNEDGSPVLECICGAIVSGNAPAKEVGLTRIGSFWTNDAKALTENSNPAEIFPGYRGNCILEGYRTIAQVPLVSGSKNIGLIQLMDKKPDLLNGDLVEFMEEFATSIAVMVEGELTRRHIDLI